MDTTEVKQEDKPVEITIILPTSAYFLSGIRDFTVGLIRNMTEFSEQWAFRFQSVVDELCNNAIEHGSASDQMIKIIFRAVPHDNIEILVQDTGTGKNKMTAEQLKALVDDRRKPDYVHTGIRGRGLSKIVSEWTDELEFTNMENGGIQVRVKKFLKDPKLKEMSEFMDSPHHLVLN